LNSNTDRSLRILDKNQLEQNMPIYDFLSKDYIKKIRMYCRSASEEFSTEEDTQESSTKKQIPAKKK
jgi:hypothetical protein